MPFWRITADKPGHPDLLDQGFQISVENLEGKLFLGGPPRPGTRRVPTAMARQNSLNFIDFGGSFIIYRSFGPLVC